MKKRPLDSPELPFPFSPVSNGEWCPPPKTPEQRAAERLYLEEADRRARRLGISRREFVRSAAGTATGFLVLNTIYGLPSSGGAAVLPVAKEQCDDPEAARAMFERDFFVMDVQLHHVDLEVFTPESVAGLRFLDAGLPPAERGALLSQTNFAKEVFVDSETAVGVISGIPYGIPLPVETMRETRDLVNSLAGSERAISQAMINPEVANPSFSTSLASLEHQIVDNGAKAIKCYTGSGSWWLDDEKIAYPMYEEAVRLGVDAINVHKGFPSLLGPMAETYVRTRDLDKATRDWPNLRFVVYHSGYFPDGEGIGDFLANVEKMGRRPNLYAEIGSTFATVGLSGPARLAELMGSLLKALGSWRILWGTDSIWWGSPQWQIELFKALQISEQMQEEQGFPPLTDRVKARILGMNAARLYGVDVAARRCEIAGDSLTKLQAELGGIEKSRTHRIFGPQTAEHYDQLLAHGAALDRSGPATSSGPSGSAGRAG